MHLKYNSTCIPTILLLSACTERHSVCNFIYKIDISNPVEERCLQQQPQEQDQETACNCCKTCILSLGFL